MTTPTTNAQATVSPIAQPATVQEAPKKPAHKCPGHTEFFHRYVHNEKAKKKGGEEINRRKKDKNIVKADYVIIDKNTPAGKESVYFKGLNKVYRHAVLIVFKHVDNCDECSFNPKNKA